MELNVARMFQNKDFATCRCSFSVIAYNCYNLSAYALCHRNCLSIKSTWIGSWHVFMVYRRSHGLLLAAVATACEA